MPRSACLLLIVFLLAATSPMTGFDGMVQMEEQRETELVRTRSDEHNLFVNAAGPDR